MCVEKDPADPKGKKMIWPRITIPVGARILQVEELITTSGTFKEVRMKKEVAKEVAKILLTTKVWTRYARKIIDGR